MITDLNRLWDDRPPIEGSAPTERCGTKVLDTVLFKDSKPTRWLFTNKHSRVAKKKANNLKLDRIRDRFLRLANVSDKSTGDDFVPVALVYTSDGASTSLTKRAFEELLSSSHDGKSLPGVVAIQAVVQVGKSSGCEPMDAPVYRTSFRRDGNNIKTKRLTNGRSFNDVVQLPGTGRAERAVQNDVRSIVQFIEESGNMSIRELQADFIMDDKHYMWLSRIYKLDASKNDKENDMEKLKKQVNDKLKIKKKQHSKKEDTTNNLPQVRGAQSYERPASEQSQRSARNDGSGSARGNKDTREERDAHSANTKFRKGKQKGMKRENNYVGDNHDAPGTTTSTTGSRSSTVTMMPSVGPRPTLDHNLHGNNNTTKKSNKINKSQSAMELGNSSTPQGSSNVDFPSVQKPLKMNLHNNFTSTTSSSVLEIDEDKQVLQAKVSSLDETISKMQARLTAEATVNARLTERLRTLREKQTKSKDEGKVKYNNLNTTSDRNANVVDNYR